MTIADDKLLLTVTEAGRRLGFHRNAVAALCRRGELPFVPLRGADGRPSRVHKRIPAAALREWVERHTVRDAAALRVATDGRRRA